MSSFGVYALVFPKGEIYIGSTARSFEIRFEDHLYDFRRGNHCNPYAQRLYQKYGKPEFMILEICEDPAAVITREQWWMDQISGELLINCGPAYPSTAFGRCRIGAMLGKHHSSEAKERMSIAAQNRTLEYREKISRANFGKRRTHEARARMSTSARARFLSNPTKSLEALKKGRESRWRSEDSIEQHRHQSESMKRIWAQRHLEKAG